MTEFEGFAVGDRDAVIAAADLADRAGATGFDFGFDSREGDPVTWYAQVYYRGARLFVGRQPTPEAAATGLGVRLLTGAACKCGQRVSLRAATPGCLWQLEGRRWVPGCGTPPIDIAASTRGGVAALRKAINQRVSERQGRAS